MARVLAAETPRHIGQTVELAGWLQNLRHLGGINFLILRDRSGVVQCVYEGELPAGLSVETAVRFRGEVVAESRAPHAVEVHLPAEGIETLAPVSGLLPFPVNKPELEAGLDTFLAHRAYGLRQALPHAVFHIQAEIMASFRTFLRGQGFLEVSTPKIVASGTEGGAELFAVEYFDRKAYLAQSPQFYKQMLVGDGYERVFEIGKAYRAETHNTTRHLNEYVSMDFEMGFITSHEELMNLESALLSSMLEHLSADCAEQLAVLKAALPSVPPVIPRLSLAEAQTILRAEYGKASPPGNLDPEGERLIAAWAKARYASEWLFLTKYPRAKRPFYAMPAPEDPSLTQSFDLLCRGLEVTTGGQRIHNCQELTESMRAKSLATEGFADYLEIFRCGMPPHGGLAIGLERLTMQLCGLNNIREASLFPRDGTRLTP